MATPSEIRERLAVVLSQVEGLTVVEHAPESPPSVLPAVAIGSPSAQLAEGDSRLGLDTWNFPLVLLVESGDYPLAAADLDSYLARTGPRSVRQVLADNAELGLQDGTSAYLDRIDEYGPRNFSGITAAGAVLRLVVRTSG